MSTLIKVRCTKQAFNCTLVSLIPKRNYARQIKDFMPISVYITYYKIISRLLTARLGHVIGSIVSNNQAAFIHEQQVYNYKEGNLPFRYLGVPITCKKLPIHHYMPLGGENPFQNSTLDC